MEMNETFRKEVFKLNKELYLQFQCDWGIRLPSFTQAEIHEQLYLVYDDVQELAADCYSKAIKTILQQPETGTGCLNDFILVLKRLLSKVLKDASKLVYSESQLIVLGSHRFQIGTYLLMDNFSAVTHGQSRLALFQALVWEI